MSAKAKSKEASGKTVTMTRHQYDEIERYAFALNSIGKLFKDDPEDNPGTVIDILANGILDILEDIDAGRLDHGKMVRPVPPEPKGGAA